MAPPAPVIQIGLAAAPLEPSREARGHNERGLAALKRGEVAEARAAFEAAVAASDGDSARYNLACALARGGEADRALGEIERLLARDLPTFRRRLASDPDLAPLREAPHAEKLAKRIEALEAAWRRAAAEGVPVVLARPNGDGRLTDMPDRPIAIRAGVWSSARRVFVPLGESVPRAIRATADPPTGRVTVIDARPHEEAGAIARLHVLPMLGDGEPLRRDIGAAVYFEAHPTRDGARYRSNGEPMGLLRNMFWQEVSATGDVRGTRDRTWHRPPGVDYFPSGEPAPGVPPPADMHVERDSAFASARRLVRATGGAIELADGHGSCGEIVRSPDGALVFVATGRERGAGSRHAIDRIELASGRVTRLSEGDGWPLVRFGPTGELFVQRGDRVVRLPSATAAIDAGEPLPEGIWLELPPRCAD